MLNENAQTELVKTLSCRDVAQAGALCYRRSENGGLEILFVGSRRNGRWGIPKGHVEDGEASSAAALREAFEEAGVAGIVDKNLFGTFSYRKDTGPNRYHVAVHPLQVSNAAQPGLRTLLSRVENLDL
ncbi:NUDIX hydrolase [Rhizobium laguerreae]|uniref:NUDIX hydrolase n=1 Tax=Rhizobium laguerreae TaxID=1076926 RepID=UPI001C91FB2B|nr:NUDIX hydrolase [Rhizobium laguerreae]MBY3125554.1 NUDIX hydrolase [Rhizobium laguerreae]